MISIPKSRTTGTIAGVFGNAAVSYAATMDRLDDSALMLRYAENGDVAAFEQLYARHKDPVFRYLLRQCRAREAAEDVFQEVWGKLIKSRRNYRPTAKFTTYLYRIAHNAWIDYLRRNKRYSPGDDQTALLVSDADTPEESTEKAIARENILAALADLPEPQRNAWLLREEAGLSIEEIAQVTNVGHEAAKSRLRYANTKLKQALGIQA